MKTQMNVYTALSKRKILTEKLNDCLHRAEQGDNICSAVTGGSTTIKGRSREDVENEMKANYDRPQAIMSNLRAINAAIATSNATTMLTVNGAEYSVNDLLYRMKFIADEIAMYNRMMREINALRKKIDKTNDVNLSEAAIDEHISNLLKITLPETATIAERQTQADVLRDAYIKKTEVQMLDPYGLETKLPERIDDLMKFKEEINNALNICNIQTIIEFDYDEIL